MKWDEILPLILAGLSPNPNDFMAVLTKRSEDKKDQELLAQKYKMAQDLAIQKAQSDLQKSVQSKLIDAAIDRGDFPDFGSEQSLTQDVLNKWLSGLSHKGGGMMPSGPIGGAITPIVPAPRTAPPASTPVGTTASNPLKPTHRFNPQTGKVEAI